MILLPDIALRSSPQKKEELLSRSLELPNVPLARALARIFASDRSPLVREAAAEAFGEVGQMQDVRALLSLARDENWSIRCAAASSLGQFRDKGARNRLLELLHDRSAPVRKWAATALAVSTSKTELVQLWDAFKEEKDDLARIALLGALLLNGEPDAAKEFDRYFTRSDKFSANEWEVIRINILDVCGDLAKANRLSLIDNNALQNMIEAGPQSSRVRELIERIIGKN